MSQPSRRSRPTARAGFTLIELLLAVTLLVLIILVSSYIFDSTMRAVTVTQANNELNISLESFSQLWRSDVRNLEHDGFLAFGGRRHMAYGTQKDRSNELRRTLRTDWAYFYTNSEQYSAMDPRVVGQWSRVLYGHGRVSDPTDANYSNLATDWVMFRHQILLLNKVRMPWDSVQTASRSWDKSGTVEGIETPETGDYIGRWRQYQRSVQTYTAREFRFHWYMNYRWLGDVNVGIGDADGGGYRRSIYEPDYYHAYIFYFADDDGRHFEALAHCGQFAISYAMPEDVSAGPGGSTMWRDAPMVGDGKYRDPNYSKIDPLHRLEYLPRGGEGSGRMVFGPGDRWPALLRLEAHIYDPLDRLDGGKKLNIIVPVP